MPEVGAALAQAAAEAFELLGFLFVEPDAQVESGWAPAGAVQVRFTGPVSGAVVVRGDASLMDALAMNMLGSDAPPDATLQLDALGEIANVICGNVLPTAVDPAADFRLAPPVPVDGEPDGLDLATLEVAFDSGVARISLLEAWS